MIQITELLKLLMKANLIYCGSRGNQYTNAKNDSGVAFGKSKDKTALFDTEVRLGEIPKSTAKNNPRGMKKATQRDSPVTLGTQFRGGAKLGYQRAKD